MSKPYCAVTLYLRENVLDPLNIPPERYVGFDVTVPDLSKELHRVDTALASWGGIDLSVLGLGISLHLLKNHSLIIAS